MSDQRPILTTRQGHPVRDNQSTRTVGERGPRRSRTTSSSRRSRISTASGSRKRVVHARGAGAHGYFEAYGKVGNEPASKYTRARVLNETGVKTPMFVRFSTVAGAKESPETERDPRGFDGQVQDRRRQLGPRGQQPQGVLHPRRDQVPRHDPRV
ncbi:catalase [Methylobacterium oryzae CBMB20]